MLPLLNADRLCLCIDITPPMATKVVTRAIGPLAAPVGQVAATWLDREDEAIAQPLVGPAHETTVAQQCITPSVSPAFLMLLAGKAVARLAQFARVAVEMAVVQRAIFSAVAVVPEMARVAALRPLPALQKAEKGPQLLHGPVLATASVAVRPVTCWRPTAERLRRLA